MNPLSLVVDYLLAGLEEHNRRHAETGVEPERTARVLLAQWLLAIVNAVADALAALARRARMRRIHTEYHRRHR